MNKLGKIKTLTIASLSAVALAAPIAFAQSTTTTQDTPQATGDRHGGHGKAWGDKGRENRGWGGERAARGGRRGGMVLRELNFTYDPKVQIKGIRYRFREST